MATSSVLVLLRALVGWRRLRTVGQLSTSWHAGVDLLAVTSGKRQVCRSFVNFFFCAENWKCHVNPKCHCCFYYHSRARGGAASGSSARCPFVGIAASHREDDFAHAGHPLLLAREKTTHGMARSEEGEEGGQVQERHRKSGNISLC